MKEERYNTLNIAMLNMPEKWRKRWCKNLGGCGCMGGANCSGGLLKKGFTEEEWKYWVNKNSKLP